jgi:nitrogen fixation NifU-like protein
MSRVPLPYSPKVLKLFRKPKNVGKMRNATVIARAGSPVCGDVITIYLKVNKKEVIERASFESYGCAANIATASILTEMVKGKKLSEAWKISWKDVAREIGGLPAVKFHCGILAAGALKRAIRAYYAKKKYTPKWVPTDLTVEEKQALEEEKLAQALSKRVKV